MTVPLRSHKLRNMVSLTEKYNNPRYIPPSVSESRCILLFQKMVDATNAIIVICHKNAPYKKWLFPNWLSTNNIRYFFIASYDCIGGSCLSRGMYAYSVKWCTLLTQRSGKPSFTQQKSVAKFKNEIREIIRIWKKAFVKYRIEKTKT